MAKLEAEGTSTETSHVFFGKALGPMYREANVLAPFVPKGVELLAPRIATKATFYSWAIWTPSFVYDTDRLQSRRGAMQISFWQKASSPMTIPATSASG